MPVPSADHDTPFHLAMRLVPGTPPPALMNSPPAYSLGPAPSSNTTSARTAPTVPAPKGDHDCPFHLAMLLAGAPPAISNVPPAYSAGPPPRPSSKTARALTELFVPSPSG